MESPSNNEIVAKLSKDANDYDYQTDYDDDNDDDSSTNTDIRITSSVGSNSQATTITSPKSPPSSTSANLYTTEIVKSKFGPTVGRVLHSYPCSLRGSSGRLYASSNSLCFYSNLFGFERSIHLQLKDVVKMEGSVRGGAILVSVSKFTGVASSSTGAVGSTTGSADAAEDGTVADSKKEEKYDIKEYTFRGFGTVKERNEILSEIKILWFHKCPAAKQEDEELKRRIKRQQEEEQEEEEEKKLTEENDLKDDSNQSEEEQEDDIHEINAITPTASSSAKNSLPKRSFRSLFLPNMRSNSDTYDGTTASTATKVPEHLNSTHSSPPSFGRRKSQSEDREEDESSVDENEDTDDTEMERGVEMMLHPASPRDDNNYDYESECNENNGEMEEKIVDVGEAWRKLKGATEDELKDVALQEVDLSCNLDTFYNNFIGDNATNSIASYQEDKIGDYDIEVSSWEDAETTEDDENDYNKSGATIDKIRTITFTHPLNNALGPTSAKSKKIQRYQRFGQHGISVEAKTTVSGVPAADTFYVVDRWIIEPKDGKEGDITMKVRFQLFFVKGTMFRGIIEKNTKNECKNWFQGYTEMLKASLAGEAKAAPSASPPPTIEKPTHEVENMEKRLTLLGMHISTDLVAVIFVLLTFVLAVLVGYSLSLQSRVSTLEKEINTWKSENILLMKEMRDMLVLLHQEAVGSRSILLSALSSSNSSLV